MASSMDSTTASDVGVDSRLESAFQVCREVTAYAEEAGLNNYRIYRGQCSKVLSRTLQLLPLLETLRQNSVAVSADSRAPFVLSRLEEQLEEVQSLLADCIKGSVVPSFLGGRRRGLVDRLEVCAAELRQCHTECLILIGGTEVRGGRGLFREISSSPMVGSSPRASRSGSEGLGRNALAVHDESGGGNLQPLQRVLTGPQEASSKPKSRSVWGLLGGSPRASPKPSTPRPSIFHGHNPRRGRHAQDQEKAALQPQGDATPSQQDRSAPLANDSEVRELVTALSVGSVVEKRAALTRLLAVSESSDDGKLQVAAAGAIPALSVMLAVENEQMKLAAAGVLLHLSWLDENRLVIAKAGCVPCLVQLLRSGNPSSRTLAARVLWNLAVNVDNKVIIAASEAIPSLVAIIQSDSEPAAKCEAAEAIVQLTANNPSNQRAVADSGAVPSLVSMLREGGPAEQDKAAFALGMLAVNNDENKLTIAGSGAAPLLLDILQSPYEAASRSAAWTLYVLSSHKISAAYITASGGLKSVQAALSNATPEAQYWARYILSILDPQAGPPEKVHSHRYNGLPAARQVEEDSPDQSELRRETRLRMFAL